jgi:hypothetical protein
MCVRECEYIYIYIYKTKECTFLYDGGLPIFNKPDCRKDLENPLQDSEDRKATSYFIAISSNAPNM